MRTAAAKAPRLALFLALTLALPAAIVAGNFAVGALAPITDLLEDDVSYIDAVWHLAQGHRLGTDFYYVLGFGVLEGAALLWRWIGPYYGVLRASADFFALLIVACGCIVALRYLRHLPLLATLFGMTVAVEASTPSIYGLTDEFGMAGYYNRLICAGLAVLFVQSFSRDASCPRRRDSIGVVVAAFLLTLLFLTKISGLVVGLAIVAGGAVLSGDIPRRLRELAAILFLVAVMIAIGFACTGADVVSTFRSYWYAAQGRVPNLSLRHALEFLTAWPIVVSCVLITFHAAACAADGATRRRCFLIVGLCWLTQVVLNMSNFTWDAALVVYLAPGAAVAVATWTDTSGEAAIWNPWSRLSLRRLHELFVGRAIPVLVLVLVLVPDGLASLRATRLAYSAWVGNAPIIRMTAERGLSFDLLMRSPEYIEMALAVNGAVAAIGQLGMAKSKIANLDVANPFPALFRAPSPRGGRQPGISPTGRPDTRRACRSWWAMPVSSLSRGKR